MTSPLQGEDLEFKSRRAHHVLPRIQVRHTCPFYLSSRFPFWASLLVGEGIGTEIVK